MSFATAHIRDNLAEQFPQREKEWPYTIGLLHCSVGGARGHEPYAPCSLQDLRRCCYDYWALGHIHQPTVLDSHIIYAGNPQGRDMGETGERGCRLVTVGADGPSRLKFSGPAGISGRRSRSMLAVLKTSESLRKRSEGNSP